MENELQIFKNEMFEVAIQLENGEVLFEVETVAKSLGFTQTKGDKLYVRWETINKYLKKYVSQDVGKGDFIPEPLVYKLAFKANNKIAEKFQDWLAIDVLPSIRKHGAYMTPEVIEEVLMDPDTIIKLATQLKAEREEKQQLALTSKKQQQVIGELKPKADYTDRILKNKGLVTITQIAKDYGMSGIKLNKRLHELGVQYKQSGQWLLYSKHHGKGYTHSETIDIVRSDGSLDVKMNTKWTQKGRLFLYDLLKENEVLPIIERDSLKKVSNE